MSRALVLILLLALPCRAGRDFEVDDANDSLVATSAAVVPSYPFSWSIWFQEESHPGGVDFGLVAACDAASANQRFILYVLSGTPRKATIFADAGGFSQVSTTNGSTLGEWSHAAVVATSATDRVVVLNGKWSARGADTASKTPSGLDNLSLARYVSSSPAFEFDGKMAVFCQWSVALTQSEVETLAGWNGTNQSPSRALYPLSIRPDKITVFFPMDGRNTGNEIDRIGGYVFTNTGTVVADSPPIHCPDPQYSHAPALRSLWRRSPLYKDEEEDYGARAA